MKRSSLKVESAVVDAGVWVSDIPEMDDLRLKVRPNDSAAVRALAAKLFRSVSRDDRLAAGQVKPEVADRVGGEVLAGAVLLDWSGLTDDDGVSIPYSIDEATAMLTNPDFRAFRAAVEWASANAAAVAKGAEEVILGNFAPPSNGG